MISNMPIFYTAQDPCVYKCLNDSGIFLNDFSGLQHTLYRTKTYMTQFDRVWYVFDRVWYLFDIIIY